MWLKGAHFDVAVVGAGPAGSAAAYHLAAAGRRVLLIDRDSFPRDKACGDALTPAAVQLLLEMGLSAELESFKKVYGVTAVTTRAGQCSREVAFHANGEFPAYGLVAPRRDLDLVLCRHAVRAGATFWERTAVIEVHRRHSAVCAITVRRQGVEENVRVSWVIAADGSNSLFVRQFNLIDRKQTVIGFALRGYYDGVCPLNDVLHMYLPLFSSESRDVVRGYGWVFPCGRTVANIGVGLYPRSAHDPRVSLLRLFKGFSEQLERSNSRFTGMKLLGGVRGAPLRTAGRLDFNMQGRVLLVGDAAGLVEPFTGEGISAALYSGRAASEAINAAFWPRQSSPTLGDKARMVRKKFGTHSAFGSTSGQSYTFLWNVFNTSLVTDRPFFAGLRHAWLQDAFVGETPSFCPTESSTLSQCDIANDIAAVWDLVRETMEKRIPMLGKLVPALVDPLFRVVRAATLLLCAKLGEAPRRTKLATAASIELAYLAHLCHLDVQDDAGDRVGGEGTLGAEQARWGDAFALMVGDYALVKSYQLAASAGTEVSMRVSQAVAAVWASRISQGQPDSELSEERYDAVVSAAVATFYALPCEMGARLAGAPDSVVNAVSQFGQLLGMAVGIFRRRLGPDRRGIAREMHPTPD